MPRITYKWDWQPDKPSNIHCAHCGFSMTITPTAEELKSHFFQWHCVKCGSCWNYGTPPKPIEPTIEQSAPPNADSVSLGYPQTRRLFERKKVGDWIILMIGEDIFDSQKVSTIATKIKAAYRFRFGKNPQRERSFNTYSGLELNACIERLAVGEKSLTNEMQTLHLEKIRREIEVGSIIIGSKGIPREVIKIIDNNLFGFRDDDGLTKSVDRSAIIHVIHVDPDKGF